LVSLYKYEPNLDRIRWVISLGREQEGWYVRLGWGGDGTLEGLEDERALNG
jgi:hypothetical protein